VTMVAVVVVVVVVDLVVVRTVVIVVWVTVDVIVVGILQHVNGWPSANVVIRLHPSSPLYPFFAKYLFHVN